MTSHFTAPGEPVGATTEDASSAIPVVAGSGRSQRSPHWDCRRSPPASSPGGIWSCRYSRRHGPTRCRSRCSDGCVTNSVVVRSNSACRAAGCPAAGPRRRRAGARRQPGPVHAGESREAGGAGGVPAAWGPHLAGRYPRATARVNEAALETPKPLHGASDSMARTIDREISIFAQQVGETGAFTAADFTRVWWRIARQVTLGESARDDTDVTIGCGSSAPTATGRTSLRRADACGIGSSRVSTTTPTVPSRAPSSTRSRRWRRLRPSIRWGRFRTGSSHSTRPAWRPLRALALLAAHPTGRRGSSGGVGATRREARPRCDPPGCILESLRLWTDDAGQFCGIRLGPPCGGPRVARGPRCPREECSSSSPRRCTATGTASTSPTRSPGHLDRRACRRLAHAAAFQRWPRRLRDATSPVRIQHGAVAVVTFDRSNR